MLVHVLERAGVKNLNEKFLKTQLVIHKATDFGLIKIINLQLDSENMFWGCSLIEKVSL